MLPFGLLRYNDVSLTHRNNTFSSLWSTIIICIHNVFEVWSRSSYLAWLVLQKPWRFTCVHKCKPHMEKSNILWISFYLCDFLPIFSPSLSSLLLYNNLYVSPFVSCMFSPISIAFFWFDYLHILHCGSTVSKCRNAQSTAMTMAHELPSIP